MANDFDLNDEESSEEEETMDTDAVGDEDEVFADSEATW